MCFPVHRPETFSLSSKFWGKWTAPTPPRHLLLHSGPALYEDPVEERRDSWPYDLKPARPEGRTRLAGLRRMGTSATAGQNPCQCANACAEQCKEVPPAEVRKPGTQAAVSLNISARGQNALPHAPLLLGALRNHSTSHLRAPVGCPARKRQVCRSSLTGRLRNALIIRLCSVWKKITWLHI